MAETTAISWADSTLNIWMGCQEVSLGEQGACTGCYARALVEGRFGLTTWGPHGARVETKGWRAQLRRISRTALAAGRPWFVFVNSLSDFWDNRADPKLRAEALAEFRKHPHLTFLLLTKRPQNIVREFNRLTAMTNGPADLAQGWPRNAAIGCTVVTQEEANRDVPYLLDAKAALQPAFAFLSMEPLMGPVDLNRLHWRRELPGGGDEQGWESCLNGKRFDIWAERDVPAHKVDWVIAGGETDQGAHQARPSHYSWFRDLRGQCATAGVPFHFKQHGEWASICWMSEDLSQAIYHPAPVRDPEASRRCKVESTVMHPDGTLHDHREPNAFPNGAMSMFKVGAKRSGRLLDGVLHDARPATT